MKKLISVLLVAVMLITAVASFASCSNEEKIIVQTNAFFAPFEYYEGEEIVGTVVLCGIDGIKHHGKIAAVPGYDLRLNEALPANHHKHKQA